MFKNEIDLTSLPRDELFATYAAYSQEVQRRMELERAPEEIARIGSEYCSQGGDPQVLVERLGTVVSGHESALQASGDQRDPI